MSVHESIDKSIEQRIDILKEKDHLER